MEDRPSWREFIEWLLIVGAVSAWFVFYAIGKMKECGVWYE